MMESASSDFFNSPIAHIVHALLEVVSRLVVLNSGRKIVEGEPRAVMASDEVRQIYLGIAA